MATQIQYLRWLAERDNNNGFYWNRAADRIEALEAALRKIAGQMLTTEQDKNYGAKFHHDYESGYDAIIEIARAALAPEQDK